MKGDRTFTCWKKCKVKATTEFACFELCLWSEWCDCHWLVLSTAPEPWECANYSRLFMRLLLALVNIHINNTGDIAYLPSFNPPDLQAQFTALRFSLVTLWMQVKLNWKQLGTSPELTVILVFERLHNAKAGKKKKTHWHVCIALFYIVIYVANDLLGFTQCASIAI